VTRTFALGLCALAIGVAAGTAAAGPWKYSLGIHDMSVRAVDSTTYGIGGHAEVDATTSAMRHLYGSFDVYVDHDTDHLDPDHIPVWWETDIGVDAKWFEGSRKMFVGWALNQDTRMNTVSSIERQIHMLPAIEGGFAGDNVRAALKGGYGYNFLEIDDDAPRLRGYDRTNLRQTTTAAALVGDTTIRIGESWQVLGHAEKWWDKNTWIQTQWLAGFRLATEQLAQGSQISFTVEHNEYNLDRYATPGLPPVLAWDDDLMFKLDFRFVRPSSHAKQ
jgi:hypothetical protein